MPVLLLLNPVAALLCYCTTMLLLSAIQAKAMAKCVRAMCVLFVCVRVC